MMEESKKYIEDYKVTVQRLQSLLDNIQRITQTGRWEIDHNANIISWTDEMYEIFELDIQKQPSIDDITNLLREEEKGVFNNALLLAINEGITFDMDFYFYRRNGNKTWIRIIGDPFITDGKVESVHGFVQDITRYKNTELAFIESKEKYKTLTGQLPLGVYRTTEDGQILYANPALVNILGYSSFEELSQIYVGSVFVDKNKREELLKEWIKTDGVHISEHQVTKKSGEVIWVRDTGQAIKNENGRILYFDGIIEDITVFKQALNDLKLSEEKYKSLTNQLPLGVYRTTKDGDFLFANPALVSILGYSNTEELLGTTASKAFYNESDREMQLQSWIMSSSIHSNELRFKRKDGKVIWVRDTGKAIMDSEGEIAYFDGIIEDITSIKKAQDALRESEGTTRVILNSSVDGIILINKDGIILDFNETILELTSTKAEELIGSSYYDLFDKEIAENRRKQVEYTFSEKSKIEFEDKVDGFSYENHIFPIFDEENKVSKAVLFSKDITNQKEYEKELIKAKEKAEEADQLKSAFLANMSHEIRTPMNSIIGFSKLIDNPNLEEDKRKQFTKIIRERTRDLLQIIDEILDISKIESAQMSVTETAVSLNHVLDEMYSFFFSKLNEEDAKDITLYIKKQFRTSEGNILTDSVKLKQILINLIDNAIKFTKQGEVLVGCSIENDEVQFFVKDTGIGISPEKQDIIFDRFRQSEEFSTRRYGGPGLGLAISKGLVELLHGKIWVESIQGVGSTFYFTIPYRRQDIAPASSSEPALDDRYDWSQYSILIVEDDNISQQYLAEVVSDTGVKLLMASNGFDAIEIVKNNKVNLILMDIQLPDMDGYETTRKIKEIEEKIPILAQTAFAMDEDRTKCFNAGCTDFIAKPIDPDALLSRISKHLK
ncbi:MAG: PAS domain S-box protein [Bacteroidales bacterium]|nr:PAS domain S-box protein [Bacteroidales bacterium]